MSDDIESFHHDFFQDVCGEADAEGHFLESSFLERFSSELIAAGEFDTFDEAHYRSARGQRVDGYCGDPIESDGVLTLVISNFASEDDLVSLTKTDMERDFRRLESFFKACLKPDFYQQLEESSSGYGLAELISSRRSGLTRLRLFLLTDRLLSSRVQGMPQSEIEDIPVTYNVWDIGRLHRLLTSGKGKEDIDIDIEAEFGTALPCLPAHVGDSSYAAYLAVVPGSMLAAIYDRWGPRLLEQNVRCFLQAKGKVNKGIRATILNEPGMFFAYNNGITATAEAIETDSSSGSMLIKRIRNLQIVNGGQTTASIFTARKRDKAELQSVFVQMKLSVVDPEEAMSIVPRISEYANSQNRVNAADFFANHPFHVRMEEFSRHVWAPSADGSFKETKWFYERARGQYADARAGLTPAKRKKFEQEYPKRQSFTKTDLAKFENSWQCKPQIVSKGAQNNFAQYAKSIGEAWDKDSDQFNERYFHHVVAKAILFRRLEKLVMEQPWYDGGYRANIVTYALAKISHDVSQSRKAVDLDAVWDRQAASEALVSALLVVAEAVHDVIVNPMAGSRNVTEWAKKDGCWERVKNLDITMPSSFVSELISPSAERAAKKDARAVQQIDNGIDAQKKVIELGGPFWKQAIDWSKKNKVLSQKDHGIMAAAAKVPSRIPSEKQCLHLMEVLERLREEACPLI